MKSMRLMMLGLFLVTICLVATPVYAQTPTPDAVPASESAAAAELDAEPTPAPTPAPVNVQAIAQELAVRAFWGILLLAFLAGGLGGLAYELITLQGSLEVPHRLTAEEVSEAFPYAHQKYMADLGSMARIIIGGLAAVAVFFVFSPTSAFQLIAVAVIAGSAGTAIFRSLQDRVESALALQQVEQKRIGVAEVNALVEQALATLPSGTATTDPSGNRALQNENSAALQEARELLAGASALAESLKR